MQEGPKEVMLLTHRCKCDIEWPPVEHVLFPSDGEMEGCLSIGFPSEVQCLRVPWQDSAFSGLSVMQRDGGWRFGMR